MQKTTEMFWAFVWAITLASALAGIGYLFPRSDAAVREIYNVASALVSGALGFFAGVQYRAAQPADGPQQPQAEPQQ